MSLKWSKAVWQCRRHHGSARCMLLALADFADDSGECYPSMPVLAKMCNVSQRNAGFIMVTLETSGDVSIERNVGPHGTNRYRLNIGRSEPLPLKPASGVSAVTPLKPASPLNGASPLKFSVGTPEIFGSSPLKPASADPSLIHKEPSGRRAATPREGVTGRQKKALANAVPNCPCNDLVALYHEHLPELPRVKTMGAKRKKTLHAFWRWLFTELKSDLLPRASTREEALAYTSSFFEVARQDDFIMGRRPPGRDHQGWRADLEYLVSEKGRARVIERAGDD